MNALPRIPIRRVLVAANRLHSEVTALEPGLSRALSERQIDGVFWKGTTTPEDDLAGFDLVLVLGGDGYMMNIIRTLEYPQVPLFGVNYGRVGFLMNPRMGAEELAESLSIGSFLDERYPVLDAQLELEDGSLVKEHAFNDFVLERASGQTVHLLTYIDDVLLNRFSGDGLIVATPGGSTAYTLAAGGPVVHNEVSSMIVTPLYPHRPVQFHSLQFPILLPLRSRVRIVAEDLEKRPVRFLADGHALTGVKKIEVAYSGLRVRLLRVPQYRFIDTLVRKIIGRRSSFDGEDTPE